MGAGGAGRPGTPRCSPGVKRELPEKSQTKQYRFRVLKEMEQGVALDGVAGPMTSQQGSEEEEVQCLCQRE